MQETAAVAKANYTLALTASNSTTGKQALGSTYSLYRLVSTVDCFVQFKVGSSPTASTTTDMFLPANAPEYFNVNVDLASGLYVSGIVSSTTGNLYVSAMG